MIVAVEMVECCVCGNLDLKQRRRLDDPQCRPTCSPPMRRKPQLSSRYRNPRVRICNALLNMLVLTTSSLRYPGPTTFPDWKPSPGSTWRCEICAGMKSGLPINAAIIHYLSLKHQRALRREDSEEEAVQAAAIEQAQSQPQQPDDPMDLSTDPEDVHGSPGQSTAPDLSLLHAQYEGPPGHTDTQGSSARPDLRDDSDEQIYDADDDDTASFADDGVSHANDVTDTESEVEVPIARLWKDSVSGRSLYASFTENDAQATHDGFLAGLRHRYVPEEAASGHNTDQDVPSPDVPIPVAPVYEVDGKYVSLLDV